MPALEFPSSLSQVEQELFQQGIELVRVIHEQSMAGALKNLELRAVNLLLHVHDRAHITALRRAHDARFINFWQNGTIIRDEVSNQQRNSSVGRHAHGRLNHSVKIFFRLRLFEIEVANKSICRLLPVLQDSFQKSEILARIARKMPARVIINEHKPREISRSELIYVGHGLNYGHGPRHDYNRRKMQLRDDCFDVARSRRREQPIGSLRRLALRTRIHCDHTIIFRKIRDLVLPNPRRHGPSRHEKQRRKIVRTGNSNIALRRFYVCGKGIAYLRALNVCGMPRFEIMNLYSVRGSDKSALHRGRLLVFHYSASRMSSRAAKYKKAQGRKQEISS